MSTIPIARPPRGLQTGDPNSLLASKSAILASGTQHGSVICRHTVNGEECDTPNESDAQFCIECGHPLPDLPDSQPT